MNVTEALNGRRSCRAFTSRPVDKGMLLKIISSATRAPSWSDTQPWEIFVASGEPLEKLRKAYAENLTRQVPRRPDIPAPAAWPAALRQRTEELAKMRFANLGAAPDDPAARRKIGERSFRFFNAPAVIYLCMNRALSAWSIFDLGALSQSIMLAAHEQDLATIPAVMLAAYPDLIRAELGIPEDLSVVIGIAAGYCDEQHPENRFRSPRRPVDQVVTFKGF